MTKHRDGPIYQTDIEPTHESQPTGATIVYMAGFVLFWAVLVVLWFVTR